MNDREVGKKGAAGAILTHRAANLGWTSKQTAFHITSAENVQSIYVCRKGIFAPRRAAPEEINRHRRRSSAILFSFLGESLLLPLQNGAPGMLQLPPVSHLSNLLDTISQNNKIVKSRESAVCKIDGTLPPANDSRFPSARKQINYGPGRSFNVFTPHGLSRFHAEHLGSESETWARHRTRS